MMKILKKIRSKFNTIKIMFQPTITVKMEKENGHPVFLGSKNYLEIPNRNDVVFYEGKNFKVLYRKFIYNSVNNDLDRVILKVDEIDKKF